MVALTHIVSPNINQCELTFHDRKPIDYERAVEQHEAYCRLLRDVGLHVIELSVNRDYPDSTFVEDTAVVLNEIAVMANMGAESRQGEAKGIELELARYREIAHIQPPATLDGGDVLQIGRKIFVGLSPRTNFDGFESLKNILECFDYQVIPVELKNCLHLKSACTAVSNDTLLLNPKWLGIDPFGNFQIIQIHEDEPWAANVLKIKDIIYMHSGFIKTIRLVENRGFKVKTVDISELLKAEAGMTCSSILFTHPVQTGNSYE